jgi:predicted negative regulator of RcsB-dependent stress response
VARRRITHVKRIALLAVFAVVLAPQAFGGPWIKSLATAQKAAKDKQRLIFVDLFADWCGWCHRAEQEVFPSEAFQKATDDMVLLRLNTEDGGEGTNLSRNFGVTSLPTFLILTPDMMVAGIVRGYAPPVEFAKSVVDTRAKYQEFVKRAAKEPTDPQQRLDLAREYRVRNGFAQSESRLKKLIGAQVPMNVRDDAYYELALSQLLQKKYDDSMKTLRKFASIQTKGDAYERSRLLVGDVYIQQGNFEKAVAEYRNFKLNFPNSALIKNVDMVLPQLERQIRTK